MNYACSDVIRFALYFTGLCEKNKKTFVARPVGESEPVAQDMRGGADPFSAHKDCCMVHFC